VSDTIVPWAYAPPAAFGAGETVIVPPTTGFVASDNTNVRTVDGEKFAVMDLAESIRTSRGFCVPLAAPRPTAEDESVRR
jgi:hypothetical protein